jgi:hypothetical protein
VLPPEWLPPLPEGARSRDPATPAGESLPAVPVA